MTFREFLFGKKEPPKGRVAMAAQWQDNSFLPVKIAGEAKTESEWEWDLVGAKQFAPDDEDWVCDEVTDFGTRENPFRWEQHVKWEDVQTNIRDVAHSYICDVGKYRDKLFSRDAVGVGFVDGNIELVYKPKDDAGKQGRAGGVSC